MNILKQFAKSIYSPKDIAAFRFQGIGKTCFYVFFLTLISILPPVFFLSTAISGGIDTLTNVFKTQLPAFSIENGVLNAKTNVPVTVNKNNFTIILDSTGAVSADELGDSENTVAILKNEFAFSAAGITNTYDYHMFNGMTITSKEMLHTVNTLHSIKMIIIPGISLFLYLFSSAANFIEISVLAVCGLAFKNLAGRRLNYRQMWIMAAYSETLSTLFFTIMAALRITVTWGLLLNWFVVLLVLYLAVTETPKPKTHI